MRAIWRAVGETYISADLRRLVRVRASACCEYCGISEEDTWFGCEVDHIISEKHGGKTESENLALACVTCNRAKGSDIASVTEEGVLAGLFHPRRHVWAEHFERIGLKIGGRSVTERCDGAAAEAECARAAG